MGGAWDGRQKTDSGRAQQGSLSEFSHRPVCILSLPLTPLRLVTGHVPANGPEKGHLSAICSHRHIPRNTCIVSKCTRSQVTGGFSGARPHEHLRDRHERMDENTTDTSVHADMSHLKDICILLYCMAQCKKTISVSMVHHVSLNFSRQGQEPQI